jgi:hypothetical protein
MTNSRERTENRIIGLFVLLNFLESDNGNVHRAAANIIVSKSRAARGSVCNVLLSDGLSVITSEAAS